MPDQQSLAARMSPTRSTRPVGDLGSSAIAPTHASSETCRVLMNSVMDRRAGSDAQRKLSMLATSDIEPRAATVRLSVRGLTTPSNV